MKVTYTVIRSARRTAAIQIADGKVIVRVPAQMTGEETARFVKSHADWIVRHLEKERRMKQEELQHPVKPLDEQELRELARRAARVIPERVRCFAPKVGVKVGRITIRNQTSRWGSCSAAGNLNFNCLLMLTPPEVIDSVVVHELCHRLQMNHSPAFYAEVRRVYPDYDRWHRWLKEHGNEIMRRNPRYSGFGKT